MWIWLDKNGKVEQYLTHGKSPVVGDTDFQIFAYFDGLDINNFDTATIKFKKPDRQGSTYDALYMTLTEMKYEYMDGDGSFSKFNSFGNPYKGFLFDFSDCFSSAEIVKLLDTPGNWEATISILSQNNKVKVSGLITFNVGSSTMDSEEQSELTLEQILENMIISQRWLRKNDTAYLKIANNFVNDSQNGSLDKNVFTINSIVYDETSKEFYKIDAIELDDNDYNKIKNINYHKIIFNYLKIENLNNDLTLNDLYELNGEKPIISKYNSKNYIISIIKNDSNSFNFNAICLNDFKKYSSTENGNAKWYISIELDKQFIEVDDNLNLESINPVQNKVITKELNNKLDKVTGTTQYTQVYAKAGNTGAQAMIGVSSSSVPSNIVRRGADSLFDVATPVNDSNPTTKKYVDDLNSSKVDKINNLDDNNPYVLYGAEFNDTETIQKTYPMSEDAIARTIARRGLSGELSVGNPTLENSATNKKYVDDKLNLYVKYSDIDTDFSLTSTNPLQNKVISNKTKAISNQIKVISKQVKDINYTIMTMKEELFETILSEIDYKVDYATIYPIPETLTDDDGTHRVVYSDTQIKENEGNSVAFNQMINGLTNVVLGGGTATIDSDNVITYTLTNVGSDTTTNRLYSTNPDNIQNHTYLVKFSVKCSHITPIRIFINGFYVIGTHEGNNQWQDFYAIRTAGNNNSNNSIYFECQSSNGYVVGDIIQVKYWNKFDLTQMFGSGNEPTTVEEFNHIFPNAYYPYNAGEIKNTVIKGVRVRNSKLATVPLNKISVVDLGSLEWSYNSTNNFFQTNGLANLIKPIANNATIPNVLSDLYTPNTFNIMLSNLNADKIITQTGGNNFIQIRDTSYTNATDFKNAMSGVLLYYECVEPQETISQEVVNEFVNKTIHIPQTELPSAGTVHDTIKFVEGNIVANQQRYNMVHVSRIGDYTFTGSETFEDWAGSGTSLSILIDGAVGKSGNEIANILWTLGSTTYTNNISSSPEYSISMNTTGRLYITTTKTSAELASALIGKIVHYEKAEPTETTLATDLTFEQVSAIIEQGGSIETIFENVPPNLKTTFVVNKAIVS